MPSLIHHHNTGPVEGAAAALQGADRRLGEEGWSLVESPGAHIQGGAKTLGGGREGGGRGAVECWRYTPSRHCGSAAPRFAVIRKGPGLRCATTHIHPLTNSPINSYQHTCLTCTAPRPACRARPTSQAAQQQQQ
ncbi:hypothetical protein E2C01_064119 [Portunus trituberculatus]|uniref:Uncharacterized protein n=1 Tax=Portunus trituberculatus TaxID=210409 RepID=A0A5B7HMF0_PORTR|nr:hypothetical protein [Portunus trituberculatus]